MTPIACILAFAAGNFVMWFATKRYRMSARLAMQNAIYTLENLATFCDKYGIEIRPWDFEGFAFMTVRNQEQREALAERMRQTVT